MARTARPSGYQPVRTAHQHPTFNTFKTTTAGHHPPPRMVSQVPRAPHDAAGVGRLVAQQRRPLLDARGWLTCRVGMKNYVCLLPPATLLSLPWDSGKAGHQGHSYAAQSPKFNALSHLVRRSRHRQRQTVPVLFCVLEDI